MLAAILTKEITEAGEVMHFYRDVDQIRLVYEERKNGHLELIGWYRP